MLGWPRQFYQYINKNKNKSSGIITAKTHLFSNDLGLIETHCRRINKQGSLYGVVKGQIRGGMSFILDR